jgi:hypothetical protein
MMKRYNLLVEATVITGAILLACSAPAMGQTNMTFNKRAVPSNTLQASADTPRGTTEDGIVAKEFFVLYAGVVRVKWEMPGYYAPGSSAYTEIYTHGYRDEDSGEYVGERICRRNTPLRFLSDPRTESCDVPVSAGDRIALVMYGSEGGISVQNARIFFDLKTVNSPAVTLKD